MFFTACITDCFWYSGWFFSPSYTAFVKNNLQSAPGTSFSRTGVVPATDWPWAGTGLFPVDKCPALWKGLAMPPFYFRASSCTPDTAEEEKEIK